MATFWVIIVVLFVVAVLGLVAYALFEISPFSRHEDKYRDPVTHKPRYEAPNLEDGHY